MTKNSGVLFTFLMEIGTVVKKERMIKASFVEDITIPDGTKMLPGEVGRAFQ